MTKIITIFFLTVIINHVHSQVIFLDSISNSIIPYVEIYSNKGVLLENANRNGEISLKKLKRLRDNGHMELLIHQMSYKSKVLNIDQIINNKKKIYLSPLPVKLSEIKIHGTPNKKIKYLKITGYFRGYQFSNNNVKYLVSGEVENYLFLNKKKQKRVIKAYQSWVNIPYVKKRNATTIVVQPVEPGNIVLYRTRRTLLNIAEDEGGKIKKVPNSTNFVILDKNSKKVGAITIDTTLSLTKIYYKYRDKEDDPNIRKAFGTTVSWTYVVEYEFYNASKIEDIKYENLLYMKDVSYADYTPKKQKITEKIKTIQEFFVTDIKYTNIINKTGISEYDFYKESNYSYPFWENIKSDLYQPLPESVEKALGTTLTELENVDKK